MILITGGAGFIGSVIVAELNNRGIDDIIIVDSLMLTEKWKNLCGISYADYYDKSDFINKLESGFFRANIDSIIHMGACSDTMETDADYLMDNNYQYTKRIAEWRALHSTVRLIYASSAATYGAGENGYSDNIDDIDKLRPMNMYGYSKHIFDLYAKRKGWFKDIVGLKFFNVFGPNEYHKGNMRSLINKAFPKVSEKGEIDLFRSHDSRYPDGGQMRDFIYVKDAVAMTLSFLDNEIGGLFNIGTGKARTWNDLALAMFAAVSCEPKINYVDMPLNIREKYQYFTEADMSSIEKIGLSRKCMSLEAAVEDYIKNYLYDGLFIEGLKPKNKKK